MDRDDKRRGVVDHRHRHEIAVRIVGKRLEQMPVGGDHADAAQKVGIAVGFRARGSLRGDETAASGHVVDDVGPAEGLRQPVGHQA